MKNNLRIYDPWLFAFALTATGIGLLFIFDAGYARALQSQKAGLPPEFQSQLLFLLASGFVTWWAASVPAPSWKKWSKLIWVANLILLVLVMVIGHTLNGGKRWIGWGPFLIQPAEFAKLAAVIYLAGYFAERKAWPSKIKLQKTPLLTFENIWIPKIKRAMPAIWVLLAVGLIELEKDLGTGAVIAATAFAMFVPGGVTRKSILIALAGAFCLTGIAVYKEPYRLERFLHHSDRWVNGNFDELEFQTVQSELAISSGGIFGVGLGNGRAKHVLPATTTDFIMATVGEEVGLFGSMIVIGVLGAIVFRLLILTRRVHDRFSMLLLSGVAFWIGIQTCVNVMMANAFLPAIGIPLPFISSGGSSLIALWLAMGACQATLAPQKQKLDRPGQGQSQRSSDGPIDPRGRKGGVYLSSIVSPRKVTEKRRTRRIAEGL